MTLYELLFILLVLGSVVSLLLSALCLLWRRATSQKILVVLASVWGIYLVILAFTDVLSSQKVFKVGEEQCFDEMCFAVSGVQTMPAQSSAPSVAATGKFYVVNIRVINHSRGRTQAEGGLRGRLYDNGTYINVSEAAQKAYDAQHGESLKLTQKIAPGESIFAVLVFEVPQQITRPALTLDHGFTPGCFVIGESPFFHKPDSHQLSNSQE
jgi:Domain of unknown function (DUF4352)